jgi:hypothetical protein
MLHKILKFRLVGVLFAASLAFVLGGTIWAYFVLRGTNTPLIIHFNDISGISQTGGVTDLLWFGLTGVVVVAVNFFISLELEARDWFWGKLLAVATLLFALLIFIGFAAIISVN